MEHKFCATKHNERRMKMKTKTRQRRQQRNNEHKNEDRNQINRPFVRWKNTKYIEMIAEFGVRNCVSVFVCVCIRIENIL